MNFYLLCFYGLMPVSNASTKAFYSYAQLPNYTFYIYLFVHAHVFHSYQQSRNAVENKLDCL